MSVKRFDISGEHYEVFGDNNGEYCLYEDYAALEQKLAVSQREFRAADATTENMQMQVEKLAAELSAVEAIHNEAVFIKDDHYEQCPPEVQKMIRSLAVLQIPAYQSFMAEVRAQGVGMLAEKLRENIAVDSSGSTRARVLTRIVERVAAQLRNEVKPCPHCGGTGTCSDSGCTATDQMIERYRASKGVQS